MYKFLFERYFPEVGIEGVFVECGAFDGLTECSCKFFEETMGWKGFNLEPVPWIYNKLCENRPTSINLNSGLSNKNGEEVFTAVHHPDLGKNFGNGSLSHAKSHLDDLDSRGCTYEEITVNLMTWPEFIESNAILHVDIFVLDVEGHELSVLEGMIGSKILPDVFCIEYGHIGLGKVRQEVEALGYVYDITSNGNAYFVKCEKVSLFTLRKKTSISQTNEENEKLKTSLAELTVLYNEIINSKAGKLIKALKKLMGRN